MRQNLAKTCSVFFVALCLWQVPTSDTVEGSQKSNGGPVPQTMIQGENDAPALQQIVSVEVDEDKIKTPNMNKAPITSTSQEPDAKSRFTSNVACPPKDDVCENDKLGFEAIRRLHEQMDDDKDGKVDFSESDEFLRDELHYESGFERHNSLHHGDDMVTPQELWSFWIKSAVYNWTLEDVLDWLKNEVELEQYVPVFKSKEVAGPVLPRIASNMQYKTNILGIKNLVHKQKLALKAMDAVLFGPPKRGHSLVKDLVLMASIVVAVGGCWLAFIQHRRSQQQVRKVMKDLASLQKAEDSLTEMQNKLKELQKDKSNVQEEKKKLESQLEMEITQAKKEAEQLRTARESTAGDVVRLQYAEDEVAKLNQALRKSEEELQRLRQLPGYIPVELQTWLQLTYEIESRHFEIKREEAERRLHLAKEMCEKIRRKRNAFMGSFRVAHSSSMDDTDAKILEARTSLEDLSRDIQERSQRWVEIERLCGFNIMTNPGIAILNAQLRDSKQAGIRGGLNTSYLSPQVNGEECDDDVPPTYHEERPRPDLRVWPSLMRAGLQLTAVGLNISNPRAALGPHAAQGLMLRGSNLSHSMDPISEHQDGIRQRTGSSPTGGSSHVDFYLGNKNNTNSKEELVHHTRPLAQPIIVQPYIKSQSLEVSTPVRPQNLSSSKSEPHISRHRLVSPTGTNGTAKVGKDGSLSPTLQKDSSPESGETGSLNSLDTGSLGKKKKSNIFSKLLKKDKTKAS